MATKRLRTLEISERGDAIASPAVGAKHDLTVLTNDPTARIVVIDERFNAVDKGVGSLVRSLPSGFYKVRVQRGASSIGFEDKLVVLDRDRTVSIEPPQFVSPAPIGGSHANDAHVAALEWLDAVVHVKLGQGSKVAFLARYTAPAQGSRPLIHPFCGLELLRGDGRRLVDLVAAVPAPHVPDSRNPIAICGIQLDPGAYTLRHHLSGGRQLNQSIIATKGWQISVNIRRAERDADPQKKHFARPGYMAVLLRRLLNDQTAQAASVRDSKDGPIDEDTLIDVARQGLADGSQLLSGYLYEMYLKNFDNPFIGILGGLLLDLEREALGKEFTPEHALLFDQVVIKLRSIVGAQHPDVEALSFRCSNKQLAHRGAIGAPPMFYRSWRILLEAASHRHGLVPYELWKRTVAAGTMPPYLIWLDGNVRQTRLRSLTKRAVGLSSQRVVALQQRAEPGGSATIVSETSSSTSRNGSLAPSSAESTNRGPIETVPVPKTRKIPRHEIALEMHVPSNALTQLIAAGTKLISQMLPPGKRNAAKKSASGKGAAASRKRVASAAKSTFKKTPKHAKRTRRK